MRTKALLLAAAFAAAGVATSVAQVYSVNAVGYVNVTLVPGFTMVANPLDAGTGNNTVGKLFSNVTPSIPAGLKVFIFDAATGAFGIPANYIPGVGFSPAASANTEILPGNGVFVFNPAATPLTATFVGQVMQGNLSNPLPQGFSIKGNQVPQAGKPDSFGLPQTAGDKIFKFDTATGQYAVPSTSTGTLWLPPTPSIGVGEGFFMFRATSPGTWNRTFSVNG